MDTTELLNVLEYRGSPNFLEVERLSTSLEHSHVFRRAVKACALHHGRLHGVYQLGRGTTSTTPVVLALRRPTRSTARSGIRTSYRSSS